MRTSDLVPLKAVVGDLGVSTTTLWRARLCNLPGFPRPVFIGRMVFWKRSDLETLEEALLRFEGRGAFERARKLAALVRTARPRRKSRRLCSRNQLDLFYNTV